MSILLLEVLGGRHCTLHTVTFHPRPPCRGLGSLVGIFFASEKPTQRRSDPIHGARGT